MNNNYFNPNISVVLGQSGSGKTLGAVLPAVKEAILRSESFIATDAKDQILRGVAKDLRENGYKIVVFNFRDSHRSDTWNPFEQPYSYYIEQDYDSCIAALDDFAEELFDSSNVSDDFWLASAKDLFVGLSLLLFEDAKRKEINFKSLYYFATRAEEKYASSNLLKEYIKLRNKDVFDFVSSNVSVALNSPTDTRGGIMSVFIQRLRLFERYSIFSETLDNSTFKASELFDKKLAIFFQFEDEKASSNKIVTIMIKMIFNMIVKHQTSNKKKLGFNFFLDDLLSLEPLESIEKYYLCSKNRGISVQFVINDIYLFKKTYDDEILKSLLVTADKIFCSSVVNEKVLHEFSSKIEYFDQCNMYNNIDIQYQHTIQKPIVAESVPVFEFDKEVIKKHKDNIYMSMNSNNSRIVKQEVDIDEILGKIDKKIEELEEEERAMNQKGGFFANFKKE